MKCDDAEGEVHYRMVELMRSKSKCAVLNIGDPEKAKKHVSWCLSSESDSRVKHSLNLCEILHGEEAEPV